MKKKYKNNSNQVFHGDVSVIQVDEKVAEKLIFKPLGKNGYTVAVGETTGNKHIIVASPQSKIEFAEDENGVFLRVLEGSGSLNGHREHEDFNQVFTPLKSKLYWVGRKNEYDPIKKFRKVQD